MISMRYALTLVACLLSFSAYGGEARSARTDVPRFLHVNRASNLLFASGGKRLRCYDAELKLLKETRHPGSHLGVTLGASDNDGNLYVGYDVREPKKSGKEKTEFVMKGRVGIFGLDCTLKKEELLRVHAFPGSVARDSRGCLYVADVCRADGILAGHHLGYWLPRSSPLWKRGEQQMYHQSDLAYVVKFPPEGGGRGTDSELWAHRGVSPVGSECGCHIPSTMLAVDGADRVYAVDNNRYHVKVLDTAGNLIARVGAWGSADCRGPDSAYPKPEIAFFWPYSIDTWGDYLYVSDKVLRRIVKVRFEYRETKNVPVP